MAKMKKVFDRTYKKGAHSDDSVTDAERSLLPISHKPTNDESDLVNGNIGELSYYTIYDKRFRIVVYIEE